MNAYGHEVSPSPNPEFLRSLSTSDILVYSCGSLWTSIMPCLNLRGVSSSIAGSQSLKAKVLLLNGENDRETDGYGAIDYLRAIVDTLNAQQHQQQENSDDGIIPLPASAYITHMIYLPGCSILVDVEQIQSLGIRCISVHDAAKLTYDAASIESAVRDIVSSNHAIW